MDPVIATLGEICEVVSGFAWSSETFKPFPPGIPIVRIQNVDNQNGEFIYWDGKYAERFIVNKGDILLTLSGSFRVGVWDGPRALLNQRIVKLLPNNKVNQVWFYYAVKNLLGKIVRMGKHALVSNVSVNELREIPVLLPPLGEQRRIATILSKADAILGNRRNIIKESSQLVRSIFLEMFGDPSINPKGFPIKLLDTVFSKERGGVKCGPFGSALKKHEYVTAGIPVWTVDCVGINKFREEGCLFITPDKYRELKSYSTQNGDILISRAGTVGRMAILKTSYQQSIIHSNLIRLSLDPTQCLPSYFVTLMSLFAARVGRLKTGQDGSYTFMNTGRLGELRLSIPPISLQKRFDSVVSKITDLTSRQNRSLQESETMLSRLQQDLFKDGKKNA